MTQKDAPAMFKTRVDMVSVPVVVRDSKGRAIGNLTKENFQVFDKGKPQEIVRFVAETPSDLAVKAAKTAGRVDAIPTELEPTATPGLPESFVAYLFDDMHLAWEDLTRAREAAGRQIAKLAKAGRAAIYTTSGQNQAEFTGDVDRLQSTLLLLRNRSISNGGGLQECPGITYSMADLIVNKNDSEALRGATEATLVCLNPPKDMPKEQADTLARSNVMSTAQRVLAEGRQETQVSLAALKDVVRRMATLPGQRVVVFISPGFISSQESQQDKSDILDRAIKSNVVINSLDARGLWVDPTIDAGRADPMVDVSRKNSGAVIAYASMKEKYERISAGAQADVLAEMAYGTGGRFFRNSNDLDEGIRQLVGLPEYYYILGFSPQNLKLDGSFHPLKVTLKTNPPSVVDIQARKGYYAPRKPSNAEDTAEAEIEQALFSREELSDLPVELLTQYFKSGNDATVAVVCRIDLRQIQFRKADGRNLNVITVVTGLFDENGNLVSGHHKTIDFKLKDDALARLTAAGVVTFKTNFSVRPGSYMIRLVVRDSEAQLMSALAGAVAIP